MTALLHPLWWISTLIYVGIKISAAAGLHWTFVHTHLADLLCMPVVLGIALAFQRSVTFRSQAYSFSGLQVAVAVLLYSFLFEWLFPRLSPEVTADPWDVLAYALGGLAFFLSINLPAPQRIS